MTAHARLDLPDGRVPPYKEFCRHVWAFRTEAGAQAVTSPPWMFSLVVDNYDEMKVLRGTIAMAESFVGTPDNVLVEDNAVLFRSLSSLYNVLAALTWRASFEKDLTSRHVAKVLAEIFLWSLGFRWV